MPESEALALRGGNQSRTRAHNERLVITLLHRNGALSRAEIASRSGLSAQAVSVLTRKLEAEGLILGGEPVRGRVGQPSIPFRLNPDGASFIGVQVGRRSAQVVRGDMTGRIRDKVARSYAHPEPELVAEFVMDAVAVIAARGDLRPATGIGIAIPSEMWNWAGLIGLPEARMQGWRDMRLAERIAAETGLPVYTRNDATAACGAELMFGRADLPADFLHLYFGYFVGGGLVLDHRLYDGPTGNAGSIGSMPIGWQGRPRQLIELASIHALEQSLPDGRVLTDEGGWDMPAPLLDRWLAQAAGSAAHAIAACCAVLDVAAVVIDGWMPATVRASLAGRIEAALPGFDFSGMRRPQVIEGTLGRAARSIGAAAIPFGAHFLVDQAELVPAGAG
ncbi:Sugar kinase of the NBD/HSP70 family, may contain an N-terminal HTH domain [Paracoccus isoporae]|uniref:Sugar kinase of the NBD/HSP70 family, may contain an N-terminal HTH domain n=1 Tax=Paracoccus isoporae TaxID=591205 RepID=A0A1G7DGQ2_9RHOB|nr:ROK family transcriptional regulator [Paracoccus isoporae]SDE50731.1 Sugar kinase of the NBD/HSP70 family, may contain an N-terminal HTH domain [Paracoccus isoporae]